MNKIERNLTIDAFRGIGILLVILGHCVQKTELPINQIILSFHMPLFFFCSGMLAKEISWKIYPSFLIKKIKSLMLPQLFIAITEMIYAILVELLLLKQITIKELSPIQWLTSWFLLVLLYVSIMFPVIMNIICIKKRRNIYFLLLVEIIIIIITSRFKILTISSIEKIPVAIFFYTLGYVLQQNELMGGAEKRIMEKLWVIIFPILVLLADFNTPVRMYLNDYGNIILFLMTSLLGIALCYYFSEYMHFNSILTLFGKNSIIVFCSHFIIVKMFRLVINFCLPDPLTTMDYPFYFLLFIFVITCEYILIYSISYFKKIIH